MHHMWHVDFAKPHFEKGDVSHGLPHTFNCLISLRKAHYQQHFWNTIDSRTWRGVLRTSKPTWTWTQLVRLEAQANQIIWYDDDLAAVGQYLWHTTRVG